MAYDRATARESRIWRPFAYSFPFSDDQIRDRGIIFAHHSLSYLNYHKYLTEIDNAERSNLLSDYNSKIAGLATQETALRADIVSKRIISRIDEMIHDDKLATMQDKIAAEDEMWTAKIAALDADEAALQTLAAKVESETQKIEARITELEAQITIEGVNLTLAELEISEKEIQAAKVDLAKLDADNAVLKIQIETLNAASQVIDVALQIARIKTDQANTDANIAKIGLLSREYSVAQAQATVASSEAEVAAARVSLAAARGSVLDSEITHAGTMAGQATEEATNKTNLMTARHGARVKEIEERKEDIKQGINARMDESTLNAEMASRDAAVQQAIDDLKAQFFSQKVYNSSSEVSAHLAALSTTLAAEIITKLTHTIGKK